MAGRYRNIKIILVFLAGILVGQACDERYFGETGLLEGRILIGPLCPVQTDPPDPGCLPTADTYKAYPVGVWTPGGRKKITQLKPALDGSYITALNPGIYLIRLETVGTAIGGSNLPYEVNISSGNITRFDIDIDTGIR